MTTQTLILNTDQHPIKEKHVAFRAVRESDDLLLYEVVEAFYPHPQAPEEATISRLEIKFKAKEKTNSERGAYINLILLADQNAKFYE